MGTFKAYIKKEIKEYSRQYKYLILVIGIIGFALFTVISLKFLPEILKNQLPPEVASFFKVSEKAAVQSYIKNLLQLGNFFVIFTYCGSLSDEISSQKLVFPYSKGASPLALVSAKFIHYSSVIVTLTFIGFFTTYYYASVLFNGDPLSISQILASATLFSIYFIFNISLLTFISSLFKKGITAGIITLAIIFTSIPLTNLNNTSKLVPYKLVENANLFTFNNTAFTITFTLILSICFVILTVIRMNKIEVI